MKQHDFNVLAVLLLIAAFVSNAFPPCNVEKLP